MASSPPPGATPSLRGGLGRGNATRPARRPPSARAKHGVAEQHAAGGTELERKGQRRVAGRVARAPSPTLQCFCTSSSRLQCTIHQVGAGGDERLGGVARRCGPGATDPSRPPSPAAAALGGSRRAPEGGRAVGRRRGCSCCTARCGWSAGAGPACCCCSPSRSPPYSAPSSSSSKVRTATWRLCSRLLALLLQGKWARFR
ncbi:hypothetical protein C2845_PM09G05940 [Panicum miliaceum]|uniref:Uncharacterized protein n=1 Tax=Panicum miliaceum TaxID=4540 RepID=A0A3L6RYI8_PANMI|nr:hypothetical protein C2845_PM09G05940 [Panicum miliaceum]